MSTLFRLDSRDLLNGLIVAVGTPVVAYIASWLNVPGFDFSSFDFALIAKLAASAGFMYLTKNLFSTADGRFMGIGKKVQVQ